MSREIREQLGAALREILPAKQYRIVPHVGTVDRLAKRTVQLELTTFEPSRIAGGARAAEVTVHVVTHLSGINPAAEDDADAAMFEVFEALESLRWANPTRAEKVVFKETNLGYDITTEVITRKRETAHG